MKSPVLLLVAVCLSACGQSEPRSVQYFEANPNAARLVKANCRDGSVSGDECNNADMALEVIEGQERFARFRGKK